MKNLKKFNEFYSFSEVKVNIDEDRFEFSIHDDGLKIGYLIAEKVFSAYDYEFYDLISDEEYDNIFGSDNIIKIEHIEVIDGYKNLGISSKLIKYCIKYFKDNGHDEFYLNASPMGLNGLRLEDLVNLYKKFGFKELLDQGNNVIMYLNEI